MYVNDIVNFNCEFCTWGRHCDKSNPASFNQWVIPNIIDTNICLKPMVTSKSLGFLKMYTHYKNRLLPYSGGILDQPYSYIRAMEIIESELGSSNGKN